MGSGSDAIQALEQLKPLFHPDPERVNGALENQFTTGPREVDGAGGKSYAISGPVLQYLADLPASGWTSVESGCGYSTVVLANVFATHICVNPDLASNRLVREFVERHFGATGLRHVEKTSDQGLPALVAENARVDLALIDGNHSHPFPILDFHYMDQMLAVGGRLLVDNTEIDAVQELIEYLDLEPAYSPERLIGNCAVYRKVRNREFGWKSQVFRRSLDGGRDARRELALLRVEVAPALRAALTASVPLLPVPAQLTNDDTEQYRRTPARSKPIRLVSVNVLSRFTKRNLSELLRWYISPSGALAALALLLLAVGFSASGLWRLLGVAGVLLLAAFLPYKFLREQRRTETHINQGLAEIRTSADQTRRHLGHTVNSLNGQVAELNRRTGALTAEIAGIATRFDALETRLKQSRRFTAAKPEHPGRYELTLRDATTSLQRPPGDPPG